MFTLSINIILNIGLKKRKGVESNVQLLLNPLSVTKTAGVPACLLLCIYLFFTSSTSSAALFCICLGPKARQYLWVALINELL